MNESAGQEEEHLLLRTVSPKDTVLKKCRICFQAERVSTRQEESCVTRGKETPSENHLDRIRSYLLGSSEAHHQKDADDDSFISPCRCSGSMAWVHKSCLRVWRNRSPRRDSFYQCEQCFTEYRFRQTRLARIISHPLSMRFFTLVMLVGSFLGALVMATLFVPGFQEDDRPIYMNSEDGTLISVDGSYFAVVHKPGRWTHQAYAVDKKPETARETPPTSNATHSTISYLNVAYWISGHSLDEREDAQNDFFAAIADLSPSLCLIVASFILLAIFAFLRDGGQLDCLQATLLLVSLVMWCVANWNWVLWVVPMPTLFGLWKFGIACVETVDIIVDTLVKQTASELDNFLDPN